MWNSDHAQEHAPRFSVAVLDIKFFLKSKMRCFILLLLLLLVLPLASAIDQVVINSKDWQDIYSGVMYAKLNGIDVKYITEETQGIQLIEEVLDRSKPELLLIESKKNPLVFGYESKLEKVGFNVKKFSFADGKETNLELAKKIVEEKNIDQFIVINEKFGRDAISVAPFTLLTNSFVLFINEENKNEIINFLSKNPKKVLTYGRIDRGINEDLIIFNPEIINNNNYYEDNIEIIEKFLDISSTKQIFLTDGETLELGFFNNEFPVLFIGKTNVPKNVIEFIKGSDIRVGVVIGYGLFANAKTIREQTGIKILLKYGQGRNSQLYALDIIELPGYSLEIDIETIRYNTLSKQLEVIYKNKGDIYAYVQALSHKIEADGIFVAQVGDENTIFLNENDAITSIYNVDLSDYLNQELTSESKIIFGENKEFLSKLLTKKTTIEIIASEDHSKIDILDVKYNQKNQNFEIVIRNIGKVDVFADPEIINLVIADEKTTAGAEQQKIKPGKKKTFEIKTDLEGSDFNDNKLIKVHVRYGEKKDILLNSLTEEFDFDIKRYDYKPILLIIIILIAIKLWLSLRKKRKFP